MLDVLGVGEASHRGSGQAEKILVKAARSRGNLMESYALLHSEGSLLWIVAEEALLSRLAIVLLQYFMFTKDVILELRI